MIEKLLNFWLKKKTKNFTVIPLLVINFDYKKYKECGKSGSCVIHVHPDLGEDDELRKRLEVLCDYIREKHDMEKFTRVF